MTKKTYISKVSFYLQKAGLVIRRQKVS